MKEISEKNPHIEFEHRYQFINVNKDLVYQLFLLGRSETGQKRVFLRGDDVTRYHELQRQLAEKEQKLEGAEKLLHYLRAIFSYAPLKMGICYLTPEENDIGYGF